MVAIDSRSLIAPNHAVRDPRRTPFAAGDAAAAAQALFTPSAGDGQALQPATRPLAVAKNKNALRAVAAHHGRRHHGPIRRRDPPHSHRLAAKLQPRLPIGAGMNHDEVAIVCNFQRRPDRRRPVRHMENRRTGIGARHAHHHAQCDGCHKTQRRPPASRLRLTLFSAAPRTRIDYQHSLLLLCLLNC